MTLRTKYPVAIALPMVAVVLVCVSIIGYDGILRWQKERQIQQTLDAITLHPDSKVIDTGYWSDLPATTHSDYCNTLHYGIVLYPKNQPKIF
jgi:hypothetical protein